jgi:hypothetical protein
MRTIILNKKNLSTYLGKRGKILESKWGRALI